MNSRPSAKFNDSWRRQKSRAFDLGANSSARRTLTFSLWGNPLTVYANANLSVYSAQRCNASCPFCVEELRPASRGVSLQNQKRIATDDEAYFSNLEQSLEAMLPLCPTVSITGGEPSKDPRLPRILECVAGYPSGRKTLTTNGSGLLDSREGRRVIEHIADANLNHLNISIADPDQSTNASLMRLRSALSSEQLRTVVQVAQQSGARVRLSCVLLQDAVNSLERIISYLEFARNAGINNVIFRQLMKSDPRHHAFNSVVSFCDRNRVLLEPILDQVSQRPEFEFVRQIIGYYYYVEVWRQGDVAVVFEEADLGHLEDIKRREPQTIHELVFHPNGILASTWQPWDGILGPPAAVHSGAPADSP
jgi:molybdenum cofactor biosynthesis enzyme MoaA